MKCEYFLKNDYNYSAEIFERREVIIIFQNWIYTNQTTNILLIRLNRFKNLIRLQFSWIKYFLAKKKIWILRYNTYLITFKFQIICSCQDLFLLITANMKYVFCHNLEYNWKLENQFLIVPYSMIKLLIC